MDTLVLRPFGNERFGTSYAHADTVDGAQYTLYDDHPRCPKCQDVLGTMDWMPPHHVEFRGRRRGDIVWGAGFEALFSERLLDLINEFGFTGVVRIGPMVEEVPRPRRGEPEGELLPTNLHSVDFARGRADLDDGASKVQRLSVSCDLCRQSIVFAESLILKEGSWDGTDIFVAFGLTGITLTSLRFLEMCRKHKISGLALYDAAEYWFDLRAPDVRKKYKRPKPIPVYEA